LRIALVHGQPVETKHHGTSLHLSCFALKELLVEAGDFEQVLSTVEPVRVVSDRFGPAYSGKILAQVRFMLRNPPAVLLKKRQSLWKQYAPLICAVFVQALSSQKCMPFQNANLADDDDVYWH
jgi:hypothetical protein